MLSTDQKDKIRQLRRKRFTYTEIQNELGIKVPSSSLSYICKGIVLDEAYARKIRTLHEYHLHNIRQKALARNKELHQARLQRAAVSARAVTKDASNQSLKIALAMLYLGEGSKWTSHRGLSLGNSNPSIIQLYISLLGTCYDFRPDALHARVQCRADQVVPELEVYWSKITRIPLENFYKAGVDKRTIGLPTRKDDYRGVCVIMCPGTNVQLELAAIAASLLENVGL
jgi:hypothetical protein